jgi:hypothetical protein
VADRPASEWLKSRPCLRPRYEVTTPEPGTNRTPVLWGLLFGALQATSPLGFWWLPPASVQAFIDRQPQPQPGRAQRATFALVGLTQYGFAALEGVDGPTRRWGTLVA